ncbi:UNVERIFIED_CONTAM: Aspartic proteinase CDR1 [Sesamum radiatum]|uniref:Aspartic proteinase CDR1 n=1 Tax=Sesamum radiatum TaxID=300843 RepID=A0AAW2K2S9_SESRA
MALACLKTFPLEVLFLLTLFQVAALESTGFSLKLFPWDSPNSPFYHPNLTQTLKIQMMVISSNATALSRLPGKGTVYANAIQIPVKNQALRYTVKIRIGSPATEVTLLLDTGSGPIWTLCQQSKYYFNPKKSRTYKALPCEHPVCQNGKKSCKCIKGTCVCRQSYGFAGGKIQHIDAVLSSDSSTLPVKNNGVRTFSNMIFGCSSRSPIFSGILGLDKLPVSLISQVRNEVQGRYSYCLHDGDSYLSVDQKRLGLSPVLFSYEQGGFFVDTGAQFTVLKKQAYDKVIEAFANYYNGRLKRVNGKAYHLDLCYKHISTLKSYASMTFHLEGADYVTMNLYVVPQPGILCIGLIPGECCIQHGECYKPEETNDLKFIIASRKWDWSKFFMPEFFSSFGLSHCSTEHQEKFRYSVDVKIGTPGNVVKLLLDTGSVDTFHLPGSGQSRPDIVFGCPNQQLLNLSGVLGLDRTPVSLLGQLRKESGGRFSYCLHKGDSYLTLGKDISGREGKEKTTPLIHTDYSTLFLNLTDISIGGQRLGLSPSLFSLKNGGVFMDTGIQYTMLTRKAYDKVNRSFQRFFKGKLKKIDGIHQNLQPCYKLTPGFDDYPTMTFHFDGADYEAEYTHVKDESSRVTCTAVLPGKRIIIGALQQWNTRFMFDINKNLLKFYRDDCAG